MEEERIWCIRCQEDFPVAKEPTTWRMGELRKLSKTPKWMRERIHGFRVGGERGIGEYLCGNCFFDLLDEKENDE